MNLLDAYVTRVLGYEEKDWGNGPVKLVKVEYDSYGRLSETTLVFTGETREQKAAEVVEGYHFLT
ncbi:hypothetical protein ABEX47_17330 [Paenibacillus ehimensis]|uniref:hypothetical protein n=1 Tax=Paenibacillus ehimensis TaxID=79264 RepID=UPI003D2B38D4